MPGTTPQKKAIEGTVVEFNLEKVTKGALKFQEANVPQGTEAHIGTLYLRKAHFPGEPRKVRVTIEVL